jgi:hypothetical protein
MVLGWACMIDAVLGDEFLFVFAAFKGVNQILQGDTRADKNGRAAHDFGIGVKDAFQIFHCHNMAKIPLPAKLSPANMAVGRAPALLRRERRWVRSAFGGEFNAALVAPFNSAEGRNLAAGMERQPGRSAAVCRSVARGVLGQASLSAYGSVRWLKVWLVGGCYFSATE